MPSSKTHYDVLGLLPQADDVVIKAAYKALAQKHHPDKQKDKRLKTESHDKMTRLNAAYAVLGDKLARKKYDHLLDQRAQRKAKTERAKEDKAAKQAAAHQAHFDWVTKLRSNALDEISTVRLYEEVFQCVVTINEGWVHTYAVKSKSDRTVLDFARLKAQLLNYFEQADA